MASKTIDEILKKMSPESRAAIEKMSPETKNAVKQTGMGLDKQGVAEKAEYQTTARRANQVRTSEPEISKPVASQLAQFQRGSQAIQQAKEQNQQPQPTKEEKAKAPEKKPEQER